MGRQDSLGEWIVQPEFDGVYFDTRDGDNKIIVASQNHEYVLVSAEGKVLLKPEFDHINNTGNWLLGVSIDGKYGFKNTSGQLVIKPKFSYLSRSAGLLQRTELVPPWIGIEVIRCYVDISTGSYRTGLNYKPEEPGFRWDFSGGVRTLYNPKGEKILVIDPSGKTEVVKNVKGEIIWPVENAKP